MLVTTATQIRIQDSKKVSWIVSSLRASTSSTWTAGTAPSDLSWSAGWNHGSLKCCTAQQCFLFETRPALSNSADAVLSQRRQSPGEVTTVPVSRWPTWLFVLTTFCCSLSLKRRRRCRLDWKDAHSLFLFLIWTMNGSAGDLILLRSKGDDQ